MAEQRYLISDIGGTNIRVASFVSDPRQREMEIPYRIDPQTQKPYEVLKALAEYRARLGGDLAAACLGVAGRVKGDEVQITNRPDLIRRSDVAKVLQLDPAKVRLVNDMPPHLASVDRLLPGEVIEIRRGQSEKNGSRAVLMPGTGVGVGGSIFIPGAGYQPFPSEGGHIDFAPRDQQQFELLLFFTKLCARCKLNHVSNEMVFAGEGIRRIYTFLKSANPADLDSAPRNEEITTAAAAGNLPAEDLRRRTIELYLKILGAAAGNLALMFTSTGGLYLGGSICLSLRSLLPTPLFTDAFLNSGPPQHRSLLEEIPIRLIDYKDSGLLGNGVLALGLIRSSNHD